MGVLTAGVTRRASPIRCALPCATDDNIFLAQDLFFASLECAGVSLPAFFLRTARRLPSAFADGSALRFAPFFTTASSPSCRARA